MVSDCEGEGPIYGMDGAKSYQKSKNFTTDFMDSGGIFLIYYFSILIFPLTRGLATATSAFSAMEYKALPSILIYSILQTSLPEELLFRGFLLKRMANHMPFVFANTIQAFAFGLLHGVLFASVVSLEVTFFIVFFTGAIAAYLGFVNEKKAGGSIIPSWLMHATANILSGLVSAFSLLWVDKVIKMELVEIPAFFKKR